MPSILLINPNKEYNSDIRFLLFLNGYRIEICESIKEGLNRFSIFQDIDRSFDLVLIVADKELLTELEQFENNEFFEKLIVIRENRERQQDVRGLSSKQIATCAPELVLDCVRHHLNHSGQPSTAGRGH